MTSQVFEGEVWHQRLEPVKHDFRYPVYGYALNLHELPELARSNRLFGYNQGRPVSLYDSDYLGHGTQPIGEKLSAVLAQHGLHEPVSEVWLVTSARYLGSVFNPVSFYFCYRGDGSLHCVVAEVNNTFGERHAYVLDQPIACDGQFIARYRQPKAFYVSPFNDVEGDYDFRFSDPRERVDIRMRIYQGDKIIFNAWWRGRNAELTQWQLFKTIVRYPLSAWKTLSRIHWEAFVLYFQKKMPIVYKHRPTHPNTLRADPPSALHRSAMAKVREFLEPLKDSRRGRLLFDLPNGELWSWGQGQREVVLRVLNYDFFPRVLWDGDVALGDGYVERQWDSPDVTALISYLIEHRELLDDKRMHWLRSLARWTRRLGHWLRANTLAGSRRNIRDHYDLGNELYRRFLDPTMSYSCAYYAAPDDSLEDAQQRKMAQILSKARLSAEDHVLEIGCGWGSLAIEAVRLSGCRWTGITLSEQQHAWATHKVLEAGLQDRIQLELCDYRQVQGRFTRIISVEMLEAVGHANLGSYFAALERHLTPDGLAVIQVITSPDHSYEVYRHECDWIQKEIFPGSCLPSLTALCQAMARHSELRVESLENIGPHYARTLRDWRERFNSSWGELSSLYDERFRRLWNYYLCYCEAAFATQNLADLQLVLARPKSRVLLEEAPAWL